MALLVRAHRIGAVIVDRHIGGFGPAGRALHGAAACGGDVYKRQILLLSKLLGEGSLLKLLLFLLKFAK